MKQMNKLIALFTTTLILVACQHDKAVKSGMWSPNTSELILSESTFSFASVKNKTHIEEHTIEFKNGRIKDNGQVELTLDLATVDTMIEIRDQRLRDILFEVDKFPVAKIKTTLNSPLPLMKPTTLNFELNLHGMNKPMSAMVLIQSVGDHWVVTNYEPVLVNAKDFGLDQGINQLTKIAGLQSINYEVLSDFKLVFEK